MLVLATDSPCDLETVMESLPYGKGAVYTAAFVPQKEEFLTDQKLTTMEEQLSERVRVIRLYNEREHCVHFLRELSEKADAICYVDCVDARYECGEMVGGYSLDVEHSCILKRDIYDRMAKEDDTVLQMMQSICVY